MRPLEEQLQRERTVLREALNRNPQDAVQAFLASSGVTERSEIDAYRRKVDRIKADFNGFLDTGSHESDERALYDFFFPRNQRFLNPQVIERFGGYEQEEDRLQSGIKPEYRRNFLLFHHVVDNYFDEEKPLGVCWPTAALLYVVGKPRVSDLTLLMDTDPRYLVEHACLRKRETNTAIDASLGYFGTRGRYEEDLDLREFLAMGYLNRTELEEHPEDKAALCKVSLELAPHRPEAYSELATVHLEHGGDAGIAIQLCQHALSLRDHPIFRSNLALAFQKAGNKDLALFELTKLERTYPNFEGLEEVRERIKGKK